MRALGLCSSAALGAAACTYAPSPEHPCPALPANALPHAAAPLPAVELRDFSTHVATRGGEIVHGTLVGGGEHVRFTLREGPAGDAVRPLVLVVPILAGGEELIDQIASRLLARGFDVVTCERAGQALRAPQRGADLDALFARTVLHQRLVLHWLRQRDSVARPFHVLGISLGGMVTTVLAALEHDLAGVAVCLSGGDLADLVPISSEGRVQSWRRWRRETDGVGDDHLRQELGAAFAHEPLRFAPSVATDRVFLVTAAFDTVVPPRNQDLLWEAFGRPARLQVPLGHYSAALLLDGIVAAVADHFDARTLAGGAPRTGHGLSRL